MNLLHDWPDPSWRRRLGAVLFMAAALVVVALGVGCDRSGSPGAGHADSGKQRYHCPMHPTYVSDRPGDCPICNMRLVPIRESNSAPGVMEASPDDAKFAHVKPGQFYCPMHPEVVQDSPGVCPKCNMNLVEKKESSAGETMPAVPGRVSIRLSPDKRHLIGLTLSKVATRPLTRNVRAAAVVEHDETRLYRVAPRFGGWVRQLFVNFTGAAVEKGQPLFTVYSPELFSAENEYLVAWRNLQQLPPDSPLAQRRSAESLLQSARVRLELWQVDEKEIRELEERGTAGAEVVFRAPASGHVLVKNVVEGKAFTAGETLYEIADLSHLWVRAYINEHEFPLVKEGMNATIVFPPLKNQSFSAEVTFIYPHLDPQSRRGQVRLELDNREHQLRPEMWATVELELDLGELLAIPRSAVIDTGERYVAFVEGPDLHLEPREVQVGSKTEEYLEVLAGLREGEQVVTRALFLVDSESQLNAAIAGMGSAEEHRH